MKVVDVNAFYTPNGGGVRTYVEAKLRAGAAIGHEIVVVVPGKDDRVEPRAGGGRIIHVASPRFALDLRYRCFSTAEPVHRILDAERPDVVEASSPWRTATIVTSWRGHARRALVMHADPLASYAYRWLEGIAPRDLIDRQFAWFWRHLRRNANECDIVVSANERLTTRLRAGGLPTVTTIPLGIDRDVFSASYRCLDLRSAMLARCNLPTTATLAVGMGRLSPEKRWPMIIDACRLAGMNTSIGLVLIGDGKDRKKIERHIAGNPHIFLAGRIADRASLSKLLASADLQVHGCESETFGLSAAEGQASGLPLVVPDDGGAADLARAGRDELYRSGNARDCARAIIALSRRKRDTMAALDHPRSLDDHFLDLFDLYNGLRHDVRLAA